MPKASVATLVLFIALMSLSSESLDSDVPPATTYNTIPETAFEEEATQRQGASVDRLNDDAETSPDNAHLGGVSAAEELLVEDGHYTWVNSMDGRAKVLEALAGLKAFCIRKQADAHDAVSSHSHSAFLAFVDEFGNDIPKAKTGKVTIPGLEDFGPVSTGQQINKYNILENFGYVMGKIQSKFSRGVGSYILKHMDHTLQAAAVGDDPSSHFLVTFDDRVGIERIMFNPKAAGFNSTPTYLKKLSDTHSRWSQEYEAVYSSAQHILDNESLTLWKAIASDDLQNKFRQFYQDNSADDTEDKTATIGSPSPAYTSAYSS